MTLPGALPRELRGRTSSGQRRSPSEFARARQALAHPDIGRALVINFLVVFWFAGMEQTFRLFTDDAFSMSVGQTGALLGLVGVAAAVVQGGLIGRFPRRSG